MSSTPIVIGSLGSTQWEKEYIIYLFVEHNNFNHKTVGSKFVHCIYT